jgi:alpha-L-fucosidase
MISYKNTSPYFSTKRVDNYLDLLEFRPVPAYASDVRTTLDQTYQYRPDLLANDLYGTPDLWWVFAVRNVNVIRDPIFDFKAGITIFLPNINTIKMALGI